MLAIKRVLGLCKIASMARSCAKLAPAALLVMAFPAQAEVRNVGDGGFTSHHERHIEARPAEVYAALTGRVSEWWEDSHSWSADASNLYLDATPGGCFCERLPNGGWVEHLRIVYLAPGHAIRFQGALGPLLELGLNGTMSWQLAPGENGGTGLTWTYIVNGYMEGGFDGLAPVVDAVNGAQVDGLVSLFKQNQ
jgi:uncharacterized protein YndB with AHSA1/START domain